MKIVFAFSEEKAKEIGTDLETLYYTVKCLYEKRGLICLKEAETLEFGDTGHQDDYAKIWVNVLALVRSDWFCKTATQCIYFEDEEDFTGENVLEDIDSLKHQMALP